MKRAFILGFILLAGCAAWKNRISCDEYKRLAQEGKLERVDIHEHFDHGHSTPRPIQVLRVGKCWNWWSINKSSEKASAWCYVKTEVGDNTVFCTREYQHKGKHHAHTLNSCIWVW